MKTLFLSTLYAYVLICLVHCATDDNFHLLNSRMNSVEEYIKRKDTEHQKQLLHIMNLHEVQSEQLSTQKTLIANQAETILKLQTKVKHQNDRISEFEDVIARLQQTERENPLPKHADTEDSLHPVKTPIDDLFQTQTSTKTSKIVQRKLTRSLSVSGRIRLPSRRFVAEGLVAFSAGMTATESDIGVNQNIVFDSVSLNVGGAYHNQHGIFIAPQSGIYLISCTLLSQYLKQQEVHAEIVHDGKILARIFAHKDSGIIHFDQGSQTILVQMQTGGEVWVRNYATTSTVHGDLYSTFSGYLISSL